MRIIVKSQKEYDALPKSFDEFTHIQNMSDETIVRYKDIENSVFENHGKSSSENYNNSTSINYDNSKSINRDNSSSTNYNNSISINYNNSNSTNYSNSSSENWDNSRSVNWNNSSSRNRDNSSSINYDNSSSVNNDNSSSKNYANSSSINYNNSKSVNYTNSRSVNNDNSSSMNWDNSSSTNWNNSTSIAYQRSNVYCRSEKSKITAYDNTSVYLYEKPKELMTDETVNVVIDIIKPSFEEWLERGIVYADGLYQKLISQKSLGEITIYTTDEGYVARNGDKFSHGKTIDKTIKDLRYKTSDRYTSKYKSWKLSDTKSLEEIIEAYRIITGACEEGTKLFCEGKQLKENMTIKEAVEITNGSYGSDKFKEFF